VSTVVGIDWARPRWVGVVLGDGAPAQVVADRDLAALVDGMPEAACIGIDMPIGTPRDGVRAADLDARSFVGARRSSVFLTPPAEVLAAAGYAEANKLARATIGQGISQQAWGLRNLIAVVAAVAAADARLIEVHPEVSFAALAGAPIPAAKSTWNGQMARRTALARAGIDLPDDLGPAGAVPVADVLDAAAAAWSARRHAAGEARSFPDGAPPGARETIWY
jgi:predicted RNase H-like nuclease